MTLREQLIRDEGMRLKPYRDQLGKLTIGIGRNLDDVGLFRDEVELMLDNDIERSAADVEARLPWTATLSEPRRGALVNLTFNMGIGGLLAFRKMLTALQDEQWETAAAELLDSVYAEQVGPRAHRLAQQLRSDSWV